MSDDLKLPDNISPEIKEMMEAEMAKVEAFNKAMDKLYESMYGDKPSTDR